MGREWNLFDQEKFLQRESDREQCVCRDADTLEQTTRRPNGDVECQRCHGFRMPKTDAKYTPTYGRKIRRKKGEDTVGDDD